MIRVVHSPPGITFGSVRKSRRRQRAALCLTTSNVSLIGQRITNINYSCLIYLPRGDLYKGNECNVFLRAEIHPTFCLSILSILPRHKQLWYLARKSFCHIFGTDVRNALKSQTKSIYFISFRIMV